MNLEGPDQEMTPRVNPSINRRNLAWFSTSGFGWWEKGRIWPDAGNEVL